MARVANSMVNSGGHVADQISPSTGKWIWKDDSNTLEFQSLNPGADRLDKRRDRRQKGIEYKNPHKRGTPSVAGRVFGMAQGRQSQGPGFKSPRSRSKHGTHAHVTLDDVKGVALDMLSDVEIVSESFINMLSTDQFDEFLVYLLNYFNSFYEKRAHDQKPNPMNIEPSVAEKKFYADMCTQLQTAQKRMGQSYSVLVLGIGMERNHHMACGLSRVSNTYKDRSMYETLYSFCTFAIWITFRRKEYESVRKEIGRMLRSDTFNPAIRIKNAPETNDTAEDESKDTSDESVNSSERNPKQDVAKITPAEYRRLQGKRPAIKSIINQRSPALVAILPSPKEESLWLFKKKTVDATSHIDEDYMTSDDTLLSAVNLKMGIIGELMSQYNAMTLTPVGVENEEEEGDDSEKPRRESTMTSTPHGKTPPSQDMGVSRQPTALSQATTEALSDEDE